MISLKTKRLFLLIDPIFKHILLVDLIKAGLWLPAGGHVEQNEHPMETVKREVKEELGIEASFKEKLAVWRLYGKFIHQALKGIALQGHIPYFLAVALCC